MKVFQATTNLLGDKRSITKGGEHIFSIDSSANFGGGTLTCRVYDAGSNTLLATAPDKYAFTESFEPFSLLLAPGLAIAWELSGATGPNIPGIFMHVVEV